MLVVCHDSVLVVCHDSFCMTHQLIDVHIILNLILADQIINRRVNVWVVLNYIILALSVGIFIAWFDCVSVTHSRSYSRSESHDIIS